MAVRRPVSLGSLLAHPGSQAQPSQASVGETSAECCVEAVGTLTGSWWGGCSPTHSLPSGPVSPCSEGRCTETPSSGPFYFQSFLFRPTEKQAQELSSGATGNSERAQRLVLASGVLLLGLKLGAEESRHRAILVGGMDMKQRPWVGSVKANHAAGAKARRGPTLVCPEAAL